MVAVTQFGGLELHISVKRRNIVLVSLGGDNLKPLENSCRIKSSGKVGSQPYTATANNKFLIKSRRRKKYLSSNAMQIFNRPGPKTGSIHSIDLSVCVCVCVCVCAILSRPKAFIVFH